MTKGEILENTTWDEYEMGSCSLFVSLFEKEIPFIFFQEYKPKPSISDKMVESINDLLSLNKSKLETIKELLYEECLFAFQVSDYGCEAQDGETHLDAHLREFGISNKEDTYDKCYVKAIHIAQENDELEGRYSEIKIETASDNYISIVVKDGEIIDFDDDGTYMGSFEKDEQYAKTNREKTLGH